MFAAVPPEEREEIEALLRHVPAEPLSRERWGRIVAAARGQLMPPAAEKISWGQGLVSCCVAAALFIGLTVLPAGVAAAERGDRHAHTQTAFSNSAVRPLR